MLGYYLVPRHNGIGQVVTDLKPEMVAFLVYMPEIEEFLKKEFDHSALARMIVKSISQEVDKIKASLKEQAPA